MAGIHLEAAASGGGDVDGVVMSGHVLIRVAAQPAQRNGRRQIPWCLLSERAVDPFSCRPAASGFVPNLVPDGHTRQEMMKMVPWAARLAGHVEDGHGGQTLEEIMEALAARTS